MITIILALSPAVISAAAAVIVSVLVPVYSSRRQRRDEMNQAIDRAIAALYQLNASRYQHSGIGQDIYVGTDDERHRFQVEIQEESLKRFIAKTNEARLRLSDIVGFFPELSERLAGAWEIQEHEVPELISQVEAQRKRAVKLERLFRSRKLLK